MAARVDRRPRLTLDPERAVASSCAVPARTLAGASAMTSPLATLLAGDDARQSSSSIRTSCLRHRPDGGREPGSNPVGAGRRDGLPCACADAMSHRIVKRGACPVNPVPLHIAVQGPLLPQHVAVSGSPQRILWRGGAGAMWKTCGPSGRRRGVRSGAVSAVLTRSEEQVGAHLAAALDLDAAAVARSVVRLAAAPGRQRHLDGPARPCDSMRLATLTASPHRS